jgi:hypothetical protein
MSEKFLAIDDKPLIGVVARVYPEVGYALATAKNRQGTGPA